jgi:hypothetical protein
VRRGTDYLSVAGSIAVQVELCKWEIGVDSKERRTNAEDAEALRAQRREKQEIRLTDN